MNTESNTNQSEGIDHTTIVVKDTEIWEKSVALNLTLGRFGTQRRSNALVDFGTDENGDKVDADQDMFIVHKSILDCPELKEITRFDGQVRNNLRKYVLPHLFKDGIYLVPNGLITTVYEWLEQKQAERAELVKALIAVYKTRAEEAKARLGTEWKRTDYPSAKKLEQMFVFSFKLISFGIPDQLKEIQASIYEREREKAQQTWHETSDMVRQALRVAFKKLIDHAVEKLTPDDNGEKRSFRATTIENVTAFFDEFNSKNIVNDTELEALVAKAKGVLSGVSPETLRTNDEARDVVLASMSEIQQSLDSGLIVYSGRKYLDDDEDDNAPVFAEDATAADE